MATMTMLEAIRAELDDALGRDERVMVIGQDVGALGGVFRATDGLQAKYGDDRVVETPLAEASIVGSAIGLAVSGMRPIAEIQFFGFAHQAFHQIGQQVARLRFRSQGRCELPLVLRTAFGGGVRTPELHSDAFEALYVHAPGLKVVAPATAADAKGLLRTAIDDPDPVLFLEPLRGYRLVKGEVPDGAHAVPFGKIRIAREGSDVTIVAWSAAVQLAERAAEVLAAEGIEAHVVDLRTLNPLDIDGLAESGRTDRALRRRARGAADRRLRRRDRRDAGRVVVLRVASADRARRRAGYAVPSRGSRRGMYVPSVDEVVAAARRTLAPA